MNGLRSTMELNNDLSVAIFDIETTDFWADTGFMLCACVKFLGNRTIYTFRIDEYPRYEKDRTNDKRAVSDLAKLLRRADYLSGWYSFGFDLKFINTRLLYHNLPLLRYDNHIDLWKQARKRLKLKSNRLVNVERALDLDHNKTPLDPRVWQRAIAGHKYRGMNDVVKHCKCDIKTTEDAYYRLLPTAYGYPNRNLVTGNFDACPYCGHTKYINYGKRYNKVSTVQIYQCKSCGGTFSGKPQTVKNVEIRPQ